MDPVSLKYANTHEWVAAADDGVVTVGISDFAVHLLSDLVFVDLPDVGTQVSRGATFGEVESVKAVSDLYAPVSGEVVAVNGTLPDKLDDLSNDPYGAGWLIKVRPSDPAELNDLLGYEAYRKHCESESH